MRTIEYLSIPELAEMYFQAALAGLAVVTLCGVLSVFVVVKRLGFVGQGVSHAALGGVGVAAIVAAFGLIPGDGTSAAGLWQWAIVTAFCVLSAVGIAAAGDRRALPFDTAIGMFLVGSMALGAILVQIGRETATSRGQSGMTQSWESILFGSIMGTGLGDVALAWGACIGVLLVLWGVRRPLLFWGFDSATSRAFGVPASGVKYALMVLLAVAVVTAMRLTGVILATALLVLPGATALRLTGRLWPSIGFSVGSGVLALLAGLVLSIETDWQAGPSVVVVQCVLFVAACVAGWLKGRMVTGKGPIIRA
ncbi:MAG: metal ABC transporter permease [Phycisphaeraceae bacterium]|nr:metal ABC transporter permease [Phycisphaeraceae bacterium]